MDSRGAEGGGALPRLASALLVALAVGLPFEAPLVRVGPLLLTTVEVALYATIVVFGVAVAARWARGGLRGSLASPGREPAAIAAVVYVVVLALSAAQAPTFRSAAIKFVLRTTSGVLAFAVARSLAQDRRVRRWVAIALVVGAVVSAVSAILEALVPSTASLWKVFREGGIVALGLPRASGVFGYPTIAAMYWEATLPLACVLPVVWRRKGSALVALLAGAVLAFGTLATASRAGLAGAAVSCAALAAVAWGSAAPQARSAGRVAAAVVGVLVVSCGVSIASSGPGALFGQRLRFWHDDRWFGVEYLVDESPRQLAVGERFRVPVTLRNTGTIPWPRGGEHPTYLAYHWQRDDGPTTHADYEGTRTELAVDVDPGGVLEVAATVRAPDVPGKYRLQWDLVQERVTWFSNQGNPMPEEPFDVEAPALGDTRANADDAPPPVVAPAPPSRPSLWRAAATLWQGRPLLGVGPDNFRRLYTTVLPLSPEGKPYQDARLHANSLYAETLADEGVLGVVALVVLFGAAFGLLGRTAGQREWVGLAAALGVGTFFVHGVLDYFFEFTPPLGLFWVLLGLASAAQADRSDGEGPSDTRA